MAQAAGVGCTPCPLSRNRIGVVRMDEGAKEEEEEAASRPHLELLCTSSAARRAPRVLPRETTMTYRLPYAVAERASHGDDVHAGYSPWPRGSGRVLSDSPGVHVVHFRLV